ncbi:hypothetical protein FQN60_008400 [Etheostoma spectabile]|uniref:Uncharacterized protein n=1 Tax=Etheostoma spectabile TaxID=54343 RepID=A0A5J5CWF5_9PERO|nr:hypothetical protein FQN60_008400 [Etheostoma spectabile]
MLEFTSPTTRTHCLILHSHLYVFGGKNEEQEFNDLKVMKLINPSERQPVMKEILSSLVYMSPDTASLPQRFPMSAMS